MSPTTPPPGVSLFVPVYNEVDGVVAVLDAYLAALGALDPPRPFEIIVVDDASTDGTGALLDAWAADKDAVTLLRHPTNRGYGATMKTAMARARYPWVMTTDADGTYPARHVADLLVDCEAWDMVVGARVGRDVHVDRLRAPPKWALRKLASLLVGRDIPDLNTGLRLVRLGVLREHLPVLPDGFSFTSTITVATLMARQRVRFDPIDYLRRVGRSKIRPIYDTANFARLIVRTALHVRRRRLHAR